MPELARAAARCPSSSRIADVVGGRAACRRCPASRSHSCGADERARAFGRGVVLVHDRAEPLDQRLLHRDRTRRGAVDHVAAATRRRSVARTLVGQREQAVEHGRHHVRVRDAVALDQPQRLLRVPAVHQHDAGAVHQRQASARTPAARRGTAARCTGAAGSCPGRTFAAVTEGVRATAYGLRARDALGPAGRARRVEHARAELGIVDVVAGLARRAPSS